MLKSTKEPIIKLSKKNHIVVNKTATYYSLGDIKTAKTIWFVLHGYGMLAEYSEYSKNFGILTPGQLGILNLLRKLGTLRIFRILGKLGILRILGIKTMKCQ